MLLSKFGRGETSLFAPLVDFCEEIANLEHQIYVLTRYRVSRKDTLERNPKNIKVNYVRLPPHKLSRFFQFLKFFLETIRLIKTQRIDAIYSHIYGFYGLINVLVSKITNRRCFHWHCGFVGHFLSKMSFKDRLTGFIPLRITFKYVDRLITGTNATRRHYIELFSVPRKKIEIMPNGVSLTRFNPFISADDLKEKLGIYNKRMILYIHHLSPRKGPRYLIEAMPTVKSNIPNCVAIMIGDGPQKNELKRIIKNLHLEHNVFLIGGVPNADIPKYLAIADVLVVPSVIEAFSRVLVEGMACKTPIVSTKVGGTPEIAPDKKIALLVPPRNSKKLAEGIIRLLNDQKLVAYLSRNGHERAVHLYSQKVVARRFIEIVNKTIRNY